MDEEQRRRDAELAAERVRAEERRRVESELAAAAERLKQEELRREAAELAAERVREEERRRVEAEIAKERQRTAEALEAARRAREDERARLEGERREREEAIAQEKREAGQRRRALRRQSGDTALADAPEPPPQPLVVSDDFAEFREEYDHVVPLLFRHMPLAGWARTESWHARRQTEAPEERERDEVREWMASLALPPHVAGVTYARGCRIRRVRVPGGKNVDKRGAHQTVILSRRALEEARAVTR